jgi:hypothetical protein
MKVIFLDIDGVLNSLDNMRAMTLLWKSGKGDKSRDEYGHLFDNRCVMWLRYIIERTNAKIVISSTWRSKGVDNMLKMWEARGIVGEVIGCTPTYADDYIINLYAATNNEADRGYEIAQWLYEHEQKLEAYCIIDDDSDMLSQQMPFFVQTKSDIGLDQKSAQKVIAILNQTEYQK